MDINGRAIIADSRASAVLYRYLMQFQTRKTILVPVNICSVVPQIIHLAGFNVEYVDILAEDLCPDRGSILRKLANRASDYSGILFNFTYGIDLNVEDFYKQIKSVSGELFIIEDKCSCMPSMKYSETCDLTLYSTGYAKQIDLGYGGYGIVNSDFRDIISSPEILHFPLDGKQWDVEIRKEINLAFYFESIENSKSKIIDHKKKLNAIYHRLLPPEIQLEDHFNDWRFNIVVPNKNEILDRIFSLNLFASSHYKVLDDNKENYPVAAALHNRIINLFNDFYFDEDKAMKICKIINNEL